MANWYQQLLRILGAKYDPMNVDPNNWTKGTPTGNASIGSKGWTEQLKNGFVSRESQVGRTFVPGSIITAPRRLSRIFENVKALKGAMFTQAHSTGNVYSIAAANVNRVQAGVPIDTQVIGTWSGNEDTPVFAKVLHCATYIGNKPFCIMPFIVIGENGESIVATDSASTEPVVASKASISGGSYTVGFGDIYEATRRYEGAVVYRFDITMDLTGWHNRYADYYRKKLEAEEEGLARILRVGICVFGQASTTVTQDGAIYNMYFQHPSDKLLSLSPS